jgi:hypothetical protein
LISRQGILPKLLANCRVLKCAAYQHGNASVVPWCVKWSLQDVELFLANRVGQAVDRVGTTSLGLAGPIKAWLTQRCQGATIVVNHDSQQGLLPKRLANCLALHCTACQYGDAPKVPWRVEGTPRGSGLFQATRAGQVVNQIKPTVSSLAGPIQAWLTVQRRHVATIIIDHEPIKAWLTAQRRHVAMPKSETVEETFTVKQALKGHDCTKYTADDGCMQDTDQRRTVSVCGVNAHSRSGVAERRIKKLQDGTGTLHTKHHPHMGTIILADSFSRHLRSVLPVLGLGTAHVTPKIHLWYHMYKRAPGRITPRIQASERQTLCGFCGSKTKPDVVTVLLSVGVESRGLASATDIPNDQKSCQNQMLTLSNKDKELQQLEVIPVASDFKASVLDTVCCHETMNEPDAHMFPVSMAGEANNRFVRREPGRQGVQVLNMDAKNEGAPDNQTRTLSLQPVSALSHVATIVDSQGNWQIQASSQNDRPTAASLSVSHAWSSFASQASCRRNLPTAVSFSAPHANMATPPRYPVPSKELPGTVDCSRPQVPVRLSFTALRDRIPVMGLFVKQHGTGHVVHVHFTLFKHLSGALPQTRIATYTRPITAAWHHLQSYIGYELLLIYAIHNQSQLGDIFATRVPLQDCVHFGQPIINCVTQCDACHSGQTSAVVFLQQVPAVVCCTHTHPLPLRSCSHSERRSERMLRTARVSIKAAGAVMQQDVPTPMIRTYDNLTVQIVRQKAFHFPVATSALQMSSVVPRWRPNERKISTAPNKC